MAGYSRGYSGNNNGALIGLGIGLFALGRACRGFVPAWTATDDRYDYGPPPPPPPAYRYGYDRGYGYGY